MPKTILVTGGAGFVGSHLCDRLLGLGHTVISLDNFYTGRRENHAGQINNPRFRIIEADVVNAVDLKVDQIYNLASPASPIQYQASPVTTLKTGLLGAINMLELAARTGARILQASTSEVYGDPQVHPQPESYLGNANCYGERACYDEAKRASEALYYAYAAEHGVEVRIARIFNTYGPRMQPDDGRVVSNFVVQSLRGEPLTIFGQGTQTRSFCYVDDLVDGLILLMASQIDSPVNLGNPGEFTMLELARMVQSATASSTRISYLPLPADDPQMRRPDITKAATLLGWAPKVSLAQGLEATIGYFAQELGVELGQEVSRLPLGRAANS